MSRGFTGVASNKQRRTHPVRPKVDVSLRPVDIYEERSIDTWIVNAKEIYVEGSVSEVRAVVGRV